mmetsp:Transcript_48611/g.75694  ORF Transcript_48611/g.75694 Transcript_48611/m.75694 type:complete len:88 (-) Transcript_48611:2712-2975(-)
MFRHLAWSSHLSRSQVNIEIASKLRRSRCDCNPEEPSSRTVPRRTRRNKLPERRAAQTLWQGFVRTSSECVSFAYALSYTDQVLVLL